MSTKPKHLKLGQWFATAICGNDILSSCLYVSGIAIIFAGVLAPLVLLLIVGVLILYKAVYTEVVEALPVNGGAYNCLLNGTSKTIAALAGIMTFLSYVATAVISAEVSQQYLATILPIPIIPATIALLLLFALLVISGIKDSANVALGIFIIHIISLSLFLILGAVYYLHGGHSYFLENVLHTRQLIATKGGLIPILYLAFSASLLGISGFESSANFVEEQDVGVFRKTLRNMLIAVGIFNPLIALVVLNSMPYSAIASAKDFLLSDVSKILGGPYFQYLIVIDAFLVLAGAVLTAYVGVTGLLQRMAADACLPSFLSKPNKKRGSYPRIIFLFFILCTSILLITGGDLLSLAGVYTIAFLSVMSLFAFGNLVLKETRTELKRTYYAPLLVVIIALIATVIGVFGNIRIDANNLRFFEIYFIPCALLVFTVVYQDYILRFLIRSTQFLPGVNKYLQKNFDDLIEGRFVVFIHHVKRLYATLEYINKNETGRNITIIHCKDHSEAHEGIDSCEDLKKLIPQIQTAGAFPHLSINVIYKNKEFSPELLDEVSKELHIRKNRILIGSIHHTHDFDYDQLGGVRIIF